MKILICIFSNTNLTRLGICRNMTKVELAGFDFVSTRSTAGLISSASFRLTVTFFAFAVVRRGRPAPTLHKTGCIVIIECRSLLRIEKLRLSFISVHGRVLVVSG